VCVCVCVSELISLPWFSKELKMSYQRTFGFVASSLYLSFANQYLLGGGFPFPIVLDANLVITWSHNLHAKTAILGKPSKSGLIGV
jgi:hypothetical protein